MPEWFSAPALLPISKFVIGDPCGGGSGHLWGRYEKSQADVLGFWLGYSDSNQE